LISVLGGYGKVFYLNQKRHSKCTKIGKFIDKNKVVKWHPPGKADAMPLGKIFIHRDG